MWRFADDEGIWRYPVSIDDVSPYYLDALLTYEDRWFYDHPGINPLAVLRAAVQNIRNGKVISGTSTISMQVARMIEPHPKTWMGKMRQVFRTFQLEWHLSKDEILTLYLNRVPFGRNLEWVGAASWFYLQKSPQQLNRSDAVLLAVLPQAPSYLRPDRYPERAEKARNKVSDRLAFYHIWSQDEVNKIKQDGVWVAIPKAPSHAPLLARRLSQQYPSTEIIHSNIEFPIQEALEKIAFNAKGNTSPKTSLAILVVDANDMSVKGYVGSMDLNDSTRFGHVDMVTAIRSPGSTLKPFLFAFSIEEGLIPSASLLQDVPRISTDYRPKNFSQGFSGPVSASEALQRSLNLPFVQLIDIYGPARFTNLLRQAGIQLRSKNNVPNNSYILGGGSTSLQELVTGYSLLARQGKVAQPRYVTTDSLHEKELISEGAAWVTGEVLTQTTDAMQLLSNGRLAVKTGTSYDFRDAWAIGFNSHYIIGVWVGRPDGAAVSGQYGRVTAVPILQRINEFLVNYDRTTRQSQKPILRPNSVSTEMICWPTGLQIHENDLNCYQKRPAFILRGMIPTTFANLYPKEQDYGNTLFTFWVNDKGKRVASYGEQAKVKKIALWPIALDPWVPDAQKRNNLLPPADENCPPQDNESIFNQLFLSGIDNKQHIRILSAEEGVILPLKSEGGFGKRWLFLDDELISELELGQEFELKLEHYQQGKHYLTLLDESGQVVKITFFIE